ncbi:hypothetical protein BDE02_14G137500 [Populus trichocarpa]|nr:hypothetical protein BDE02_14G137500 [Populus trichocarpa]KAI5565674.1 hypothetical protein BDE02_14G137500 [Populus trichocarpa]
MNSLPVSAWFSPSIDTDAQSMLKMLLRTIRDIKNGGEMGFSSLLRRSFSVRSRTVVDMGDKDGELRVFMVAGEVSGDSIASRLMASLKKLSPLPIRFSGVGGPRMSKEGLESLFPMEDISVMGMWELLPHLNKFRVRLKETIEGAILFQPHVVVTVDSKGFSFRLLKQLRARYGWQELNGPLHFHYVAPSFWAWKGGEARLKGLANFVDHILCILPNEEAVCKLNGLDATFVGHPVLEDIFEFNLGKQASPHDLKIEGNSEDFRRKYALSSGAAVISLLPGSRLQEHVENYIDGVIRKWPVPAILIPGGHQHLKYDAFSASRIALCTSGTVAMELQLARLPCVVAYRAHILTEWYIQYKAKIPYISLPNILTDSAIIPEALFQACTPTNLASLLMKLMHNKRLQEEQIVAAENVIKLLFPSERIINNLEEQRGWKFPNCTPSMIASSTILSHVKS